MPYDRRSRRVVESRHPVVILEGLEARQLFAVSTTVTGFTLAEIRHAYEFDQISLGNGIVADGTGQTIAIVDAFDHPSIAAVKPGHNETAVITLTNTGNVAAVGTVDLNLLASSDSVLDAADVILGTLTCRAINLAPGKSMSLKVHFAAPVDATPGDFQLIASVASSTTPADTNTTNDADVAPTFLG